MAAKKRTYIGTNEVVKILKVSPETLIYLRQQENLPFTKQGKYIHYIERDVLRWRNKKLIDDGKPIINLKEYYMTTRLARFITYVEFVEKVKEIAFVDNHNIIQYIKRQNVDKDLVNLVGDIVHAFWDDLRPKCIRCGRSIISNVSTSLCGACRWEGKLDIEGDDNNEWSADS